MKLILSRKGFDSSCGGQASPIMPDGTLLSLPIPDDKDIIPFSSLKWGEMSYLDIIQSLRPRVKYTNISKCHLDPDIRKDIRNRLSNWQPTFGQIDTALSHLRNQNVSIGDIFLFYGWFRETEIKDGYLRYKKGDEGVHIIYGYMQIGKIIERKEDVPEWCKEHPHYEHKYDESWKKNKNAIFLPSEHLTILPSLKGYGILNYRKDRVLTKEGLSRRFWDLPDFFKKVEITYNKKSWQNDCFKSAGRGQEFVMDTTPEIANWVKKIIQ